ncbi:hypothetical protein LCGC14_0664010 [marine sediment metagenome]|uniref:Uncharacterized protein n=1 Tax=marine sediment metagenome TaxID=412755 RepID=A0A0F9TE53_9ZZZZ
MAKKKDENKSEDAELLEINRTAGALGSRVWELEQRIISQGERIDRLVDAISRARKVKGI